ncbi:unnamed protein product [Effrenium voratum]|nr:unnamed protein product [Effrenium voratum]
MIPPNSGSPFSELAMRIACGAQVHGFPSMASCWFPFEPPVRNVQCFDSRPHASPARGVEFASAALGLRAPPSGEHRRHAGLRNIFNIDNCTSYLSAQRPSRCGNVTFQVDDSRDSWVNRWSDEFFDRHWPLLLVMAMEIAVVGGLYIYKVMWVRVQKKRAKNSAVMRLTEEFSLDLLRHFMPSAKVEKYRFRGMAKKKAVASVSFESINLELPSGERILENVSGEFKAGRMCAILGPSGAGKTSLMNVLCGKASYAHVSGSVRFNGVEGPLALCISERFQCWQRVRQNRQPAGNYEDYKTVMGFVPQDDIVHEAGSEYCFRQSFEDCRHNPTRRRSHVSSCERKRLFFCHSREIASIHNRSCMMMTGQPPVRGDFGSIDAALK